MAKETCNWICLAKLQIDVGEEVLRNIFSQNIRTSCLGKYKSFWLKTYVKNQCRINFCSILWANFFQQFCKLDHASQEDLKPLIESLRSKSNQTLSKQVDELKTWMNYIRNKLESCEAFVQEKLLSWERQIQDEIGKLCSLLGVLKDWNTSFLSLWNKYQNDLSSKMHAYCDNFVSTSRTSLSNIRNASKGDLQTFSNTFEKDAQSMKETCQKELTNFFKSWNKNVKALVNSWHVPETIPHYDHILKRLVSEVKDKLPRLKKIYQSDQRFNSWYMNLRNMQASWQRQIADTVDNPTKIEKLAQIWQLNMEECPSYEQEQLKIFFLSKPVLRTLISMLKDNILTDDQFFKLTRPNAIPDLRALNTTCLLILLKRNGLMQPPELGWQADTSDTDLSAGADLLRLESYTNDMIRDIENPLIPKEKFQQVEDVLSRLASHGGIDFHTKIKTRMDNIKTCTVEEPLERHFKRVVINSCKRAIWADYLGLSLSGRSMQIATTLESYIKILRSLPCVEQRISNPSEVCVSIDVENSILVVDASSKDYAKGLRQLLAILREHCDVRDTDHIELAITATCPDSGKSLPCINKTTNDVSQSKMIDNIPETVKRNREEEREGTIRKRIKTSHPCSREVMTTNLPSASTRIYDEKNILEESTVVSALDSTTVGLVSEKDTKVMELLRSDDCESVEDLLRERKIPTKLIIITAVKECRYNKSVQYLLRGMSNLLKKAISNSVGVWCGYRPEDPNCPVFVVTLKDANCELDSNEILKPFSDYDIITRYKNVPSDEERTILEKTGEKIARAETTANINICITRYTEALMREHSNLSIIRANAVKARGYLKKQLELVEETCIVLSVPVKGIIPIGQKEFPKSIDGIVTDVREGEFVLFGPTNADRYHHQLRMGCSISRPETKFCGTLGGFIDLPGSKVGCLTAAHVVLTEDEIQRYIKVTESRRPTNEYLKTGKLIFPMYQTEAQSGSPFGKVDTIALQEGITSPSVDAAIIEITDDNIIPKAGNFPEGDFSHVGFEIDQPMLYNSGKILDPIPPSQRGSAIFKFGITTGMTRGFLGWNGTSARVVFEWGNFCFPAMFGQLEIASPDFAYHGDSGALAFLCYDGDVENLQAIGMVIGGSTTRCSTLITPITAIFQELGLSEKRFKVFSPSGELGFRELADCVDGHEHLLDENRETLNSMSGRITTLDNNINQRITNLDTNINQRITSLNNSINQRVHTLETVIASLKDELAKGFQGIQEFMSANRK